MRHRRFITMMLRYIRTTMWARTTGFRQHRAYTQASSEAEPSLFQVPVSEPHRVAVAHRSDRLVEGSPARNFFECCDMSSEDRCRLVMLWMSSVYSVDQGSLVDDEWTRRP